MLLKRAGTQGAKYSLVSCVLYNFEKHFIGVL